MPKCADLNLNMCQQNSSSEHLKYHLFKFHWKIVPISLFSVEMFYLNSTLNFGILPVLVFQLEVYYKLDRLLTGLTAQQKGATARWYSNNTSLVEHPILSLVARQICPLYLIRKLPEWTIFCSYSTHLSFFVFHNY